MQTGIKHIRHMAPYHDFLFPAIPLHADIVFLAIHTNNYPLFSDLLSQPSVDSPCTGWGGFILKIQKGGKGTLHGNCIKSTGGYPSIIQKQELTHFSREMEIKLFFKVMEGIFI